ncbi:MAG: hypothetical protein A2147_06215 [Chloroflexi bacterium RBG_16_57_8]|nr:MAG: hypothetical protein A2147_06215 [Chloroflexi bacterium RBG_16_57_8]
MLGITTNDLRRAILDCGDVSSFAGVYRQALCGAPIPIVSQFDAPLELPSPRVLLQHAYGDLAAALSSQETVAAVNATPSGDVDLRIVAVSVHDDGSCRDLTQALVEFQPDAVALGCSPSELGVHMLYAFSMPCAVGLGAQFEIIHGGSFETCFNGSFQPGDAFETGIIEAWLRRIPLLPVGRPLRAGERKRDDQSRYIASRIRDIWSRSPVLGRTVRILAIVDRDGCGEVEQLAASVRQGTALPAHMPPETDARLKGSFVIGGCLGDAENHELKGTGGQTEAQRRFQSEFDRRIEAMDSERLSAHEATAIVATIASRLREHPDVVRGPSVRGTIAFDEIISSLSGLNGGVTRRNICKAALIALPPRITVRRRVQERLLVADIVKETLYAVRFSALEEATLRGASEGGSADDIGETDRTKGVPRQPDTETVGPGSYAVVPESRPNAETAGNPGRMTLSGSDPRDRYTAIKQAVMLAMSDLEDELRAGKLTAGEYEQRKAGLMSRLKSAFASQMRMSDREMAGTIIEMMDAQDKGWNRDINFSRMQVYYHIKGTCEKSDVGPFKQDYHALKWLIDGLSEQGVLRSVGETPGFLLTGFALDILLKYLTGNDGAGFIHHVPEAGGSFTSYRGHEVRRYSPGDTFRDLSVRHTLKEVVRRKKALSEIGNSELRVFLKERRKPQADIVICIDTSGSMGFGQRLTCARLAAAGLARSTLSSGNRAGLVAFNDYGQTVLPLTGNDGALLLNGIAGLSAGGNTNIGDGLKSARELLLRSHSRNRKHIILISDGRASAVSEAALTELGLRKARDLTEESALLETNKAAIAGVQVSVIYVAPRDESVDLFIKNVARSGGGKVHRMSGLADLKAVLHQGDSR